MKSKVSLPTTILLALAILLSLPAMACSVSLFNNTSSGNAKETDLAIAVKSTIEAVSNTQVAQDTSAPPDLPTQPVPSVPPTQPAPSAIPTRPPAQPTVTPLPNPSKTPVDTPVPLKAVMSTSSEPWIGEIVFASQVENDTQPVDPGTVFKKGIHRIYAIFPFSGFQVGDRYTLYWTVNGKEFVSAVHTWEWESSGIYPASTFYTNNRELDTGTWQFSFFYGNQLLGKGSFKIVP